MKNLFVFALCILFSFSLSAQNCSKKTSSCTKTYNKSSCTKTNDYYQSKHEYKKYKNYADTKVPKWVIGSIGLSLGQDQDRLSNLGNDYFLDMVKTPLNDNYSNMNFEKGDIISMTCENPNVRLDVSLVPTFARNLELRLGINAIGNRIDAISYNFNNFNSWEQFDNYDNNSQLSFTSYSNELALEGALIKTAKLAHIFKFSAGIGSNVGASFNNRLHIYGSDDGAFTADNIDFRSEGAIIESYTQSSNSFYDGDIELSNGFHHRAFVVGGAGVTFFKRLELGVEGRLGMGYRYNPGAAVQATKLSSIFLTARWNLKSASKYQKKNKKSCSSYYNKKSCSKSKE